MQPRPSRLAELEQAVERGQRSFVEVGKALRTIRDERLYDEDYGTFEVYCRARFGMGRDYLNKVIRAVDVVENLDTSVSISEGVIRPLTKLEPDDQRKVWREANERWNKPTAKQVTEVIAELFPKPAAPFVEKNGPTSWMVLPLDTMQVAADALIKCLLFSEAKQLHELLGIGLDESHNSNIGSEIDRCPPK